jgi:ParB/RepB/Spo0J family partition protein
MDRAPHDPVDEAVDEAVEVSEYGIVEVAVASLTAHPLNADIYRDDADEELIASVREHGVTTPIEVTGANVVISGHRRLSAARQAGLTTVPAFVRNYPTDEAAFTAMLRANLYRRKTREQLTREIEAGLSHGKGVREISGIVGASKSTVAEIASGVRTRTPGQVGPTKGRDGRNYPARVTKPSRNGSDQPAAVAQPRQAVPAEDSTVNRPATKLSLDLGIPDVRAGGTTAWPNLVAGHGSRAPQSLDLNPLNPTGHGPEDMERIDASPMEFGWIQPVTVNQVTGHVIDGHSRVRLAIAHGQKLVPVTYVDLTAAQEARLMETRIQIRARLEAVEAPTDGGQHRRPIIDADDPGDMADDDPGDDTGHGPTDEDEDGSQLGHLEPMEIDPID